MTRQTHLGSAGPRRRRSSFLVREPQPPSSPKIEGLQRRTTIEDHTDSPTTTTTDVFDSPKTINFGSGPPSPISTTTASTTVTTTETTTTVRTNTTTTTTTTTTTERTTTTTRTTTTMEDEDDSTTASIAGSDLPPVTMIASPERATSLERPINTHTHTHYSIRSLSDSFERLSLHEDPDSLGRVSDRIRWTWIDIGKCKCGKTGIEVLRYINIDTLDILPDE